MFSERRIERARGGELRLRLPENEQALVRSLSGELEAELAGVDGSAGDVDPELRRLFPPVYEDTDEEAEYGKLVRGGLLDDRRGALRTVRETVERDRLTPGEAQAWLTALNDLRLVLGTRLDVREDMVLEDLDPADPGAYDVALYVYLSALLEQLVAAIAGGLPGRGSTD